MTVSVFRLVRKGMTKSGRSVLAAEVKPALCTDVGELFDIYGAAIELRTVPLYRKLSNGLRCPILFGRRRHNHQVRLSM